MRLRSAWLAGVLLALTAVGCKRGGEQQGAQGRAGQGASAAAVGGAGELLAAGAAEDLRVTPDGRFVTYLLEAKKPLVDGIPPQMRLGTAYAVPVGGGEPRRLGDGVTNVPGGMLFSPDSRHVLYLTGYDLAHQAGALHVLALGEPQAEPVKLGAEVTYFLPSPDGALVAFVDGGALRLGPLPAGPFRQVAGEVATAAFTPDGKWLLVRRRLSAAGELLALAVGEGRGEPVKLGEQVGDFMASPDSRRVAWQGRAEGTQGLYDLYVAELPELKPRRVAQGTSVFAFSKDSKWLARTEGFKPEQLGALYVGPASGEPGRKVGERVKELAFSEDSQVLAYLSGFDLAAGAGVMEVVKLPEGEPKKVGWRVPNFTWGKDGRYVAFLSRFIKPVYSVDLMLYTVGEEKAVKAHPGVFGYGFMPGNDALVFRSNCIRNGRACDFLALALPLAEAQPQTWLQGMFSYKLSADGRRVLATYARMDSETYDVAVYDVQSKARRTLDQGAQVPAYFAGPGEEYVVYAVKQGARPGVYRAPARP